MSQPQNYVPGGFSWHISSIEVHGTSPNAQLSKTGLSLAFSIKSAAKKKNLGFSQKHLVAFITLGHTYLAHRKECYYFAKWKLFYY